MPPIVSAPPAENDRAAARLAGYNGALAEAGEPFDPNLAEAVMHEAGDGEPTVVEVLRTGYLWQGRVIRAAMVKVAG